MPAITPKLLAAAVLALLVSLLGNVLLTRAYMGQRDAATAARASVGEMTQQRDGARDLATACSDAVDDLRELAEPPPPPLRVVFDRRLRLLPHLRLMPDLRLADTRAQPTLVATAAPTRLGEALAAPFTYTWTNVPAGTYTITARAVDAAGLNG